MESANSLKVTLRAGTPDDSPRLGEICYHAFRHIAEQHNFPPDFPSTQAASGLMAAMLGNPDVYSVIAEDGNGNIVGSNFLWEADSVSGVGPITIDVSVQNSAIGRLLMDDVIRRSDERGHPSIRLCQAAYHNRSLALYTKLGFDTVEPLSTVQGPALGLKIDGYHVRPMTVEDLDDVDALAFRIHGHTRHNDVVAAVGMGTAKVVEHTGRITGYTTGISFFGHSTGESNLDLLALIGAAEDFPGPGFLLPTRNSELLRSCLANGLKIIQPITLMSRGVYQDPRGAFLPSILY